MGAAEDYTKIELTADLKTRRISGIARQGNTPFDAPIISHITGNLYVGGCFDGVMLPDGIRHVVSMYPWEKYRVKEQLDSVLYVTAYDDGSPDGDKIIPIARYVIGCMQSAPTLVHCQAGLNRSSLVAATALVLKGSHMPEEAIDLIRSKRSHACLCNREFERWLIEELPRLI